MSPWNKLRATLALGLVLALQLMRGVAMDARRDRPHPVVRVVTPHKTLAIARRKAEEVRRVKEARGGSDDSA